MTFILEPGGHGTRLLPAREGVNPDDPYQSAARRIMSVEAGLSAAFC